MSQQCGRLMRSIAKDDRQVSLDIISRHRRVPTATRFLSPWCTTMIVKHVAKNAWLDMVILLWRKWERERERERLLASLFNYRAILYVMAIETSCEFILQRSMLIFITIMYRMNQKLQLSIINLYFYILHLLFSAIISPRLFFRNPRLLGHI